MKITADTNVLVRAMTGDDRRQSKIAQAELANADVVALALPALCELVWVLSQGYGIPSADIAEAIRRLINGANVVVNRPAVLIADEPTANLDAASAAGVLEIFAAFNQVGVTVLIATHDEALIGRFARKVLRLAKGSIVE